MLFWNYLIAPLYMGYSREAVAGLLLPAFLPFNLIKGCLNAAGTLLRRSALVSSTPDAGKRKVHIFVLLASLCAIILCIFSILYLNGRV